MTALTLETLRRCIGALQACEDTMRDDLENLRALEGDSAEQNMEYDLRAALAELARLAGAEARAEHQRLQVDDLAMLMLRREAP